jgi:hypothetical protein
VDYVDADGDAPSTIAVYIDGAANAMSLTSGTASNGTYQYSTTLSAGSHNYYLYCEDGTGGSDRLPTSGTVNGPSVGTATYTLDGTVTYTGSETIGVTQPLIVGVYDDDTETFVATAEFTAPPYDFSFDLEPKEYAVGVIVDMDQSGMAWPEWVTDGDLFTIYDGKSLSDDYDPVDLTGGDQTIAVVLDGTNVFVFDDDFNEDPPEGWLPSDARWLVFDDEYLMVGTGTDDPAITLYDRTVEDFTFAVQGLEQLYGDFDNGDWGLLFRFDGATISGYGLWVSNDGWWGVVSLTNEVETEIHAEQSFSPDDDVTVKMIGNTLTVYIDDTQEWSGDVSAYGHTSGNVGLYAWDDPSTANAYAFDDAWLVVHP